MKKMIADAFVILMCVSLMYWTIRMPAPKYAKTDSHDDDQAQTRMIELIHIMLNTMLQLSLRISLSCITVSKTYECIFSLFGEQPNVQNNKIYTRNPTLKRKRE